MDLRQKKTLAAIRTAFLELLGKKPLEKITVKELAEKAQISKATFYLHYQDIYDLAERLQAEVIGEIYQSIAHPDLVLTDQPGFTRELFLAFRSHNELSRILFSGSRAALIPDYVERELKKHIFRNHPELKEDIHFQTLLTYQVYGGYYTYRLQGERVGEEEIAEEIVEIARILSGAERTHHTPV